MTNADPMSPAQVQEARAALGLTQQQLADALGLGGGQWAKDTVRNWERGARPISGPARVAIRLMLAAKRKPRRAKPEPPLAVTASAIIEPKFKSATPGVQPKAKSQ